MAEKTITRKARHTRARGRRSRARSGRRWVQTVKTVSTFPPAGLFTRDAATIARVMATRRVSPGGLGSAIRMVQYLLNRGGKGLGPVRRRELEKAKLLLRRHAASARGKRSRGSPPGRRRAGRQDVASRREQSRHARRESDRLDALERSVLARRSLRPRLAPRSNTESRRSGRRTVTTRAGLRTRAHR